MNDRSKTAALWRLAGGRTLSLDRPRIVGIINATPDSFADGGRHAEPVLALAAARRMVEQGADMLDIGGESTRPGATRVPGDEQIRRVVPVIGAIRRAGITVPISIDTTLFDVAASAIDAGADAINDVSGGTESQGLFALSVSRGVGLILMHRRVPPPQDRYSDQHAASPAHADVPDVVGEVSRFLGERARLAIEAGVAREAIVLDPGLGFGKTVEENVSLISATPVLLQLGFPILSALSRKSFVGRVSLGRDSDPGERLAGTLGFSQTHLGAGARLFRVHDVAEHREVLDKAWRAMEHNGGVR